MTLTVDPITNLPLLSQWMATVGPRKVSDVGFPVQLWIIDVRSLFSINEQLGHAMGDFVMQNMANRLHVIGGEQLTLFRGFSDEIIIEWIEKEPHFVQQTVNMLSSFSMDMPVNQAGKPVKVKFHIAGVRSESVEETFQDLYLRCVQGLSAARRILQPIIHQIPETSIPFYFPQKSKFLHREKELNRLFELGKSSVCGRGETVIIDGLAGSGKTKLINHFIEQYDKFYDPWFLIGAAQHLFISPPYLPIKRALDRFRFKHSDRFYAYINQLSDSDIIEMFQFLPEMDFDRIRKDVSFAKGSKQHDYALFDAITRFYTLLSYDKGLVIWFEDFHEADTGSWQFLAHLAHHIKELPILVVISIRDGDYTNLNLKPINKKLYQEFKETANVHQINIQSFSLTETRDYLREMKFFSQLPDAAVDYVYRISKGNPLYIYEFSKYLISNPKQIKKLESGSDLKEMTDIPETIQDVVLTEISNLSKMEKEFVRYLSTFGFEINRHWIDLCSPFSESLTREMTQSLIAKNVLVEALSRTSGDFLEFYHPMVRTTVYSTLSLKKRRLYHQETAKKLEANPSSNADFVTLADHYFLAAEWEESFRYAVACGLQSKQVYAYETALQFFSRAREIAKIRGHEADFADMVQKEGEVLEYLGRYDEAFVKLAKSAKMMESVNQPYEAAHNLHLMAKIQHAKGHLDESLKSLKKAKSLIKNDVSLYGLILGEECAVNRVTGEYLQSLASGKEALEILSKSSPKRETGIVYQNLGEVYYRLGEKELAVEYFKKRLEISVSLVDKPSEAMAFLGLSELFLAYGELDQGKYFLDEAEPICAEIRHPETQSRFFILQSFLSLEHRNFEDAFARIDQAAGIIDAMDYEVLKPLPYIIRSALYSQDGQYKTAVSQAKSAITLAQKAKAVEFQGIAHRVLGDSYKAQQQFPSAIKSYQEAISYLEKLNLPQLNRTRLRLASALEKSGDSTQAERLRKPLLILPKS